MNKPVTAAVSIKVSVFSQWTVIMCVLLKGTRTDGLIDTWISILNSDHPVIWII